MKIEKTKAEGTKASLKVDSKKTIDGIVKTISSYITIEDLYLLGLIKNKHLSKVIVLQKFYEVKNKASLMDICSAFEVAEARKRKCVPKAISGIYGCGVCKNM